MNILVLAGGFSPERAVSLSSGSLIAAALRRRGHRVFLADVYVGVELPREPLSLFTDKKEPVLGVAQEIPDLDALRRAYGDRKEMIGEGILPLCRVADVVFLALHGAMGENGQLQATLDNYGIRYTGSGYIGSLLAMDKDLAKRLMRDAGLPTPDWVCCERGELSVEEILSRVSLPAVVKPMSGGSSVATAMVDTADELERAMEAAWAYESAVMVERKIEGREFTCGIVAGEVLPPVEIIPKQGFYDYENKYRAGASVELCPAPLSEEKTAEMAELCRKTFRALRLRGYARVDYIMDAEGVFWCLEANTLPGMTPTSLLPQEAAAVGISYDELCEKLALLALEE